MTTTSVSQSVATIPTDHRRPWRMRPWHVATLIAVLTLALGLRLYHLNANSLWMDELFSLENCSHGHQDLRLPRGQLIDQPPHLTRLDDSAVSPWQVYTHLHDDSHPPLYYFVLRLWRNAFGSSEFSVRLPSVLFSVLSAYLLFDLGRVLFSPTVGLFASLILALSHAQIWYAQEARGYTLAMASLLFAAASLARIERFGLTRARAAALFAGLLAGMYAHYFVAGGCAGLAAYALLRLRGPARTRTVAVIVAAGLVYLVAWGPFFLDQTHGMSVADRWQADPEAGNFHLRWLRRLLLITARLLSIPSTSSESSAMVMALLLFLPPLLVRRNRALLLPAIVAGAMIGFVALMDLLQRTLLLSMERYTLAAGPFLYLSGAAMLFTLTRRPALRYALPASLVAYCALSLPWVYVVYRGDWRDIGHQAGLRMRDGDVLVCHRTERPPVYANSFFLAVDYYAPHVSPRLLLLDGPASPEVARQIRSLNTAVYLVSDTGDPGELLPGYRATWSHLAIYCGYIFRLEPVTRSPSPTTTP